MRKLRVFAISFGLIMNSIVFNARADEGMWLPILLSEHAEAEMQRLGMKITAEDIYDINKPSLKDAIVLFGGGCTAEIISFEGLILTNHHCGFSAVQAHSSLENNYVTDGFWAMNRNEELLNPTLKVTLLIKMEDVTELVLTGVKSNMKEEMRDAVIEANILQIEREAVKGTHYEADVKAFYYGNQYFLIISETFKDVRLVGAPPSSIGRFGGDTDNWEWPRHTGDFSLFRIYADKDNKPAEYSKDNVPYQPKKHLEISLKGVNENDFTFVFGYPGTTQEYLPSIAVNMIANEENPVMIKLREKRLEIMEKYMLQDKMISLQYSAKYQSVSNYYKKMIGESKGVKKLDAVDKKIIYEKRFNEWSKSKYEISSEYGSILADFEEAYKKAVPLNIAYDYVAEAGLGIEIVKFARNFIRLYELSSVEDPDISAVKQMVDRLKPSAEGFFKNYNVDIDKEIAVALLNIWYSGVGKEWMPEIIFKAGQKGNGDLTDFVDNLFSNSFLTDEKKVNNFLNNYSVKQCKRLEKDPVFKLATEIMDFYFDKIYEDLIKTEKDIAVLQRKYMQGMIEMEPDRDFYPDANSTLRIAYGKVNGFRPKDGVIYQYFTTLEGVINKEDSLIYDYAVHPRLKDLYNDKDYGQYVDKDGKMHVCFIATNHTTGGNSGSPVLNAEGQLVGINFDRVWEGTMSDLIYDSGQCRNIALDIRYCLFIIDKFAGAGYLLNEMTFSQ